MERKLRVGSSPTLGTISICSIDEKGFGDLRHERTTLAVPEHLEDYVAGRELTV